MRPMDGGCSARPSHVSGSVTVPRRRSLVALTTAHLEPEALVVLARQTRPKARFVEIHRQRAVRGTRHNAIRTEKASQRRIVVASIIEQQARARIRALAGVVQLGAAEIASAGGVPGVERLRCHQCPGRAAAGGATNVVGGEEGSAC